MHGRRRISVVNIKLDADLACALALFQPLFFICPPFNKYHTFVLATHPFHRKVFGDSGGNDEVSSPFNLCQAGF